MKKLWPFLERALKILFYTMLGAPIYGYLTFYFVYPVVCIIPVGIFSFNGILYILYSILIALVIGVLVEETQDAFIIVVLSSFFGYFLGYIYQGFPSYLYGYRVYTSGLQAIIFISMSWFLLFIYIIFGVFGILIGGVIRDYLEE